MSYVISASHLNSGREKNFAPPNGGPGCLAVVSTRVNAGSIGDKRPVKQPQKPSH